ncbi:MAG: zinc ribbon domain-containing protein [Novosphingobium sp.]|nr:zinc ribbon domain-containing protein [Novosphingobium sp.]
MQGAPPVVDEISRPWWDALSRHEVAMQRCSDCASWVFYPRPFCPSCGGRSLTWTPVDAVATLYSWTVARVPVSKAFAHLEEPVLAIAELANGVRLPTVIQDAQPEQLSVGMALKPVFDETAYEGFTLLYFRPAQPEPA